jgi:hypothetical protein
VHRLLTALIALLLAANLAVLATGAADDDGAGGGADGSGIPASLPEDPTVHIVLPEGQAEISGDVGTLKGQVERPPALSTPFAVEVAERGGGGATIQGAIIDGKRSAIVWGAPSPMALSGEGGALLLGPVGLTVGESIRWYVDGRVHGFRPGTYRIDSPVAVGTGALASPRDTVVFDADDQTTLSTNGGAFVTIAPRPLELEGPGDLTMAGTLSVRTTDGTRSAVEVRFGPGAYLADLSPIPTGWRVRAVVNGPVHFG